MLSYYTIWYHIIQYGIIVYNMISYRTIWYLILYNMMSYYTIWYHIIQYGIIWGSLFRTHVILTPGACGREVPNCGKWHLIRGIWGWVPNHKTNKEFICLLRSGPSKRLKTIKKTLLCFNEFQYVHKYYINMHIRFYT